MCLGPREIKVEQPDPIKPPPMLATPPPPKATPAPEKVEKVDKEEDLVRSKKKKAKKIEQLKAGVKEFSAISGDVPDTPTQGITPPAE
tara:strand:- start:2354 stop:2617 length:264 start_codon:yes stop_codon:yes gene_type:complete